MRKALALRLLATACLLSTPAVSAEFRRGDCNADGNSLTGSACEISDAVFLLEYLFGGGSTPPCLEACNVNDDPRLDISDAVSLLLFCFAGAAPPPEPFSACGEDPTPSLGCSSPTAACAPCEPMQAAGRGPCRSVLGYLWDGRSCQGISGCECEGPDCDDLYDTFDECSAAHTACTDICAPMDARGAGPCDAVLGWKWDGFRCVEISGCDCEGEDCDELFESAGECAIERSQHCPPACSPMRVESVGLCELILGHYWDGGSCVPLVGCECEDIDCTRLTTLEHCLESHSRCPEPCVPMDAEARGACEKILGYVWDGSDCMELVGCECVGEDCGRLFESPRECLEVNSGCPEP